MTLESARLFQLYNLINNKFVLYSYCGNLISKKCPLKTQFKHIVLVGNCPRVPTIPTALDKMLHTLEIGHAHISMEV